MKRFRKDAAIRGYAMIVVPFNICWSYLLSRKWCHSAYDTLDALALLVVLIPTTPFAYLCLAPLVAIREGLREEGE